MRSRSSARADGANTIAIARANASTKVVGFIVDVFEEWSVGSVSAHRRVDRRCPRLDTALEIVRAVALAAEPHCDHRAALPGVAHDHQLTLARKLAEALRKLLHRQRLRARDHADVTLPILAYVDQQRRLARRVGLPCGDRDRVECGNQNSKRDGCGALRSGATTVSNSVRDTRAPGADQRMTCALIAGASPTTANTRPPGLSCANQASSSSGVEPVSAIPSYVSLPNPRAPSATSTRTSAKPCAASRVCAASASGASISTLVTKAPELRHSAAK